MREMLIRLNGDEAAVAMTADRRLEELFLPRQKDQALLGNIYLGRVENVLPGMQAAFINIGLPKNSFLYVADALSPGQVSGALTEEELPKDRQRSISQVVKKDQQVMVQVFKEPFGTKGARVTMQPSLPGRYVVLLPKGDYIAVSRRIEDESERERLKELIHAELPEGMGAIVRTVAAVTEPAVILSDLRSLVKEWRRIQGRAAKAAPPQLLYSDSDLLRKVIRDTNPADIDRILVGSEEELAQVSEVCDIVAPALKNCLKLEKSSDIFADYDVYGQTERAMLRKVWLKSGGYIIIDRTEALTAIDVNTGKYVGKDNLAETVFATNMEAVEEIARQLRLRNIGGIVIIDFIDMDNAEDKKKLLDALSAAVKTDRVRVTVMGITQLGLVELTRKKVGHSLSSVIETECSVCGGKGRVIGGELARLRQSGGRD
ncbi:MAG: Rne/Rng family ribonuclease [Firmicutes bacterium]|nr:Rne/Rng family ribonuclease [Bacillota bacterium]